MRLLAQPILAQKRATHVPGPKAVLREKIRNAKHVATSIEANPAVAHGTVLHGMTIIRNNATQIWARAAFLAGLPAEYIMLVSYNLAYPRVHIRLMYGNIDILNIMFFIPDIEVLYHWGRRASAMPNWATLKPILKALVMELFENPQYIR